MLLFRYTIILPLLFVALFATGCESRRTIVNGLDEKEANEIIVFLSNRGIEANKVAAVETGAGGGDKAPKFNITVSDDQATRAMALLNQSGLPRRRGETLLDIFRNVGLVPSDLQDKIRFQQGLAGQIASTIRKIDGVLDADVQLSFPEEDPLNPGTTKGNIAASVYVKHSGILDDPNAHLVTRIKRLVSGSINGLDYDNVTVIGDRARYAELGIDTFPSAASDEEKEYARLWSVVVAKESINQFRYIFFGFILILTVMLLLAGWLMWKLFPILRARGFGELFSLNPLEKGGKKKEETKKAGEEAEEEEEAPAEEKGGREAPEEEAPPPEDE